MRHSLLHDEYRNERNSMSYLKSSIEAINALNTADECTLNLCFNNIVCNIFGSRRNLLRFILTPESNLTQQQTEEMKQIFHIEFEKLLQSQPNDSRINTKRIVPSLTTISEQTQTLITSFLDFESIKQLKNVCLSIAPMAIGELLKMDINILYLHQIIDNDINKIRFHDIIEPEFRRYRVQKCLKLKTFLQNQTNIPFNNLLCFTYSNREPTLRQISDSTKFSDIKSSSLIFMDKSLVSPYILSLDNSFRYGSSMVLIQEFDIKKQSIQITDILPPISCLKFDDIKQMITNKINEDITLYLIDE
eukprot:158670_1